VAEAGEPAVSMEFWLHQPIAARMIRLELVINLSVKKGRTRVGSAGISARIASYPS